MNCSLASLYTGLIANSTIFSATNSCGQPPASWGYKHCICLEFWKRNSSNPTVLPIATPSVPVPDARTRCSGIVFWCDFTTENAEPGWLIYVGIIPASIIICVFFVVCKFSLGTTVTCEDAEFALILSLCFKIIGSVWNLYSLIVRLVFPTTTVNRSELWRRVWLLWLHDVIFLHKKKYRLDFFGIIKYEHHGTIVNRTPEIFYHAPVLYPLLKMHDTWRSGRLLYISLQKHVSRMTWLEACQDRHSTRQCRKCDMLWKTSVIQIVVFAWIWGFRHADEHAWNQVHTHRQWTTWMISR